MAAVAEIDDKYAELGGTLGFLGAAVTAELGTPDGAGRFRHYQGGSIYWSPGGGAHEVHGAIRDKWQQLGWEQGFLGYPMTDETGTPNGSGRFNHFQGGSIYWSPGTGAHEIHGAIRDKWASMGWENSLIGFPVTDEKACAAGMGRASDFEWGTIVWAAETGAFEVHGFINARWGELGREAGPLGYPLSDEHDFVPEHEHGDGDDGHAGAAHGHALTRVNKFANGSIYWDMQRGAYEVYNPPVQAPTVPAAQGEWKVADYHSSVVGVHSALLHTNRVLFFTYLDPGPSAPEAPQEHGDSAVLDLVSHQTTTPAPAAGNMNLFCAGHAFLADGRLLIAGGERTKPGIRALHIFDPSGPDGGSWQYVRDMAVGRWYPTPVTLPDGRILILGGANLTETIEAIDVSYEIFDPNAGPQPEVPVQLLHEVGAFTTFPFVYVLPNHKLFMHAKTRTRFLDLDSFTEDAVAVEAAARPNRNARTYNIQGTSVLLPLRPAASPAYRARVMVFGGGGATGGDIRELCTETCEIIDLDATPLRWQLAPSMSRPRVMPDAVLLPDGKVLVVNGSSTGFSDNGANPVFETEIFDPETNAWSQMANMTVPRLYHSGALLLPDGRVMTCGTDSMWNPGPFHHSQLRLEIFSPPYLFSGEPRPVIASAPAQVAYGAQFAVQTQDFLTVNEAALLRCGSTTHSFNPDQRYVGVEIVSRGANVITLQAPPDGFVAPPGYYMLFLLRGGVPSEARFVRLG